MKQYTLVLPNDRANTYRNVTLFILLMNCAVFAFILFSATDTKIKNFCFFGLSLSALSLLLYTLNSFTRYISSHRPEISFILISLVWFLIGKYLAALCILCFAVIGFYTRKNFNVVFSDDKIIYPSFPRKVFLWRDVSNVVLKDNMLTIDLKNNRLIQATITKQSEKEVDENEFNDYCRNHLA